MKYVTCAVAMIALLTIPALAQTGGTYDLSWHTVDGGGGTVTGGTFSLRFTTGQHDAGQHSGGTYHLNSGYWVGGASSTGTLAAPQAASAPHDMTKDRYLSFDPSANAGQFTALRVMSVSSPLPWYVSCLLQDASADGKLSELVLAPEFCDWTDSVIHVRGCEIVPGNEYLVDATADDVIFSPPILVQTTAPQISASRQFGDVVGSLVAGAWTAPDGLVTVNDITAVVQKFQLLPSAPHISRIDNDGKTPNGILASNDILRAVIAFAGGDFGFDVTDCLTGTCVPSCP